MVQWYQPGRTNPISNSLLDSGSWGPRGTLHSYNPPTPLHQACRQNRVFTPGCVFSSVRTTRGLLVQRECCLWRKRWKGPCLRRSLFSHCMFATTLKSYVYLTFLSMEADGEADNSSCMFFILEVWHLLHRTGIACSANQALSSSAGKCRGQKCNPLKKGAPYLPYRHQCIWPKRLSPTFLLRNIPVLPLSS